MTTETSNPADVAVTAAPGSPRTVILHYHVFKNAGTSLDRAFKSAFGEGWAGFEGNGRHVTPAELADYVLTNESATVVSSHVAMFPVPEIADVRVIPVIFVRHPLDRIRSGYDFERIQEVDTPGARNAKAMDLKEYLDWRFSVGDRSVKNFQTWRLAPGGTGATELDRALDTLARLPFVGLVEAYEQSLARLNSLLVDSFPGLTLENLHHNRTAEDASDLDGRIARLQDDLGADAYGSLLRANEDDLALWQKVRGMYQA